MQFLAKNEKFSELRPSPVSYKKQHVILEWITQVGEFCC